MHGIRVSLLVLIAATVTAQHLRSDDSADPAAGPQAPAEAENTLESMMGDVYRQLEEAPGRKGILAEQRRYSTYDEELIIRDFFRDRREGFFVDVGCAWPIKASNTYYLEKHLGWTGISIDALADYAPLWAEKRPGSQFFSYLVTDHSGSNESFFKSPDTGLSSVDREMATGSRFGEDHLPEEIQVSSITLNDLLDAQGIEEIDLLVLDIEGHELTALRGFDFARFKPKLVVIEGLRREVGRYLRANGYRMIEKYVPFDPVNRYFRPRRTGPRL